MTDAISRADGAGNQHIPRSTQAHFSLTSPPSQTFLSLHRDFVHSIAFDHYGRRIASCSGDRTVRVWDLTDEGDWSFGGGSGGSSGSEWQAHKGSVTRVAWAHPEFGQLLATCGTDHAATVWEEREGGLGLGGLPGSAGGGGDSVANTAGATAPGAAPTTRWVAKAQLTDARKSVTCLQFAPRHLGLKLATGSADGAVRIYEAIDVMNLNHWPISATIEVEAMSAASSHGGTAEGAGGIPTALSWCGGRFEPPALVVGGSSGAVSVYRYSDASRAWHLTASLPRHSGGVLDVAWAPNVGRSYHLIASCGQDNVLRVHRLKRGRKEGTGGGAGEATLEIESCQILDTNGAEVWRVAWNITGTVLASSGDGGIVQLWKSNFRNSWRCVSEVRGDT